jgi:glycosyltransferase involved in cell wall biosynthesis
LADQLRLALDMAEEERTLLGRKAMDRVRERYSWEAVTDAYESLLTGLVRQTEA